jgi:hypothetical protein
VLPACGLCLMPPQGQSRKGGSRRIREQGNRASRPTRELRIEYE